MDAAVTSILMGALGTVQVVRRVCLSSLRAADDFRFRRPVDRWLRCIEAAGGVTPYRSAMEQQRDSVLFRQLFGRSLPRKAELETLALYASGDFGARELTYLVRYMPYDAPSPLADATRSLARVSLITSCLQTALLGALSLAAVVRLAMVPWSLNSWLAIGVLALTLGAALVFARDAICAHLAKQAIDRARRYTGWPAQQDAVPSVDTMALAET